jgi:hypothetical protein
MSRMRASTGFYPYLEHEFIVRTHPNLKQGILNSIIIIVTVSERSISREEEGVLIISSGITEIALQDLQLV